MIMKKIILGLPLPLIAALVVATTIFSGIVIAEIIIYQNLEFGGMKIQEEKQLTLFTVNSPITTDFKLNSTCVVDGNPFQATLRTPLGSSNNNIPLITNGQTILNVVNNTIEVGNVTILVRGLQQGRFNCSIEYVFDEELTNVTWV